MLKNQIKIGKKVFTVKSESLKMLARYKHNKKIPVGIEVECCVCQSSFIKKKESYIFCDMNCKDDFWNKVDPRKRNNNGKNRGQQHNAVAHWCDDDLDSCDYHNKDKY